jgi:hypothetical protein
MATDESAEPVHLRFTFWASAFEIPRNRAWQYRDDWIDVAGFSQLLERHPN